MLTEHSQCYSSTTGTVLAHLENRCEKSSSLSSQDIMSHCLLNPHSRWVDFHQNAAGKQPRHMVNIRCVWMRTQRQCVMPVVCVSLTLLVQLISIFVIMWFPPLTRLSTTSMSNSVSQINAIKLCTEIQKDDRAPKMWGCYISNKTQNLKCWGPPAVFYHHLLQMTVVRLTVTPTASLSQDTPGENCG